MAELRRIQEEAAERTSTLLAEATKHNQESADRLEIDVNEATRIRTEALAEAEKSKLAAIKEAEERVQAAKAQAAAITERTQSEFAWRKQELRRETDLLSQRKQAVLNQLASLSALAQQTAQSFPEIDDLTDFDAEEGDRTVLRPAERDRPCRSRRPAGADQRSRPRSSTPRPPTLRRPTDRRLPDRAARAMRRAGRTRSKSRRRRWTATPPS